MINNVNEQQRRSTSRNNSGVVTLNERMNRARNAYVDYDYDCVEETVKKNSADGFQRIINQPVDARVVDKNDLLPTGTTMQFEGKNRKYIFEDEKTVKHTMLEDETSYKINTKSKILIAVYALVIVTIFSLIVLNTRLLKSMDENISSKQANIEMLTNQNNQLTKQFEYLSSDEVISNQAENVYNMVRFN